MTDAGRSDAEAPLWFDSHMHVFDPAYPMSPNNGFLPAPFTLDDYRQRIGSLPSSPQGGAVVSASTQGFDQTYLLSALSELGPTWVGVTQLPASVTDEELVALVRAVRFNLFRGGGASIEDLPTMARRIHEVAGWHVELYVDSGDLKELTPLIVDLPRVSVDHLGLSHNGLGQLVALAGRGVRVKATGFGRLDFAAGSALAKVHAANPQALMFGTDLPCPRAPGPFHDDDFRLVGEVLDPASACAVLHDNAVAWYRPSAVLPLGRSSV